MKFKSILPYLYAAVLVLGSVFVFVLTNPWRQIFKNSNGEVVTFATFYADDAVVASAKSQAIVYFVCCGILCLLGIAAFLLQILWNYQSMLVTLLAALTSLLGCAFGIVMFRGTLSLEYVSGVTLGILFLISLLFFPFSRQSFEQWMNRKLAKK